MTGSLKSEKLLSRTHEARLQVQHHDIASVITVRMVMQRDACRAWR